MDVDGIFKSDVRKLLSLIASGRVSEITESWEKLKELESTQRLTRLNCDELLREILHSQVLNIQEIPKILVWMSKHARQSSFDSITNDIAVLLRNVDFKDMSQLAMILQTLAEQKVYLPQHANHGRLCEAIVMCLSSIQIPSNPKQVLEFNENTGVIQNFLRLLCPNAISTDSDNLIFTCLQTLYSIISDTKQKQMPGVGLATVLQLVEPSVIPQAVQWILTEPRCDKQLTKALKVLCFWLPTWHEDRLSMWVMEFIQGLERQCKYSILYEVTEATLDLMFSSLLEPVTRQHSLPIVLYILKRQGSPILFTNIVKNIQMFLFCMFMENTETNTECIQNMIDVFKVIMLRFPESQACANLQGNFLMQPRMHVVHEIFKEPVWACETKVSRYPLQFESTIESPKPKPVTGKVGLSNLGNTCYMNSVLQALFMTRQFRQEVLNYKPSNEAGEQVILKKLQNLFVLLLYSKRISLAPTEVLLASRPTYFLPGQQQDSSEFLCHLLDVLHEQGKSTNPNCGSNDPAMEEREAAITRWTTEEDLTGVSTLQKETQSLSDFMESEILPQTQQLSDSHSDSTDSGLKSVGGEETNTHTSLVHRVLGGKSKITYQCAQCDTSSHNTDKFRDLQLCFPEEIQENQEVSVQDLINYYLTPEKLTGENKYRCDKCTKLCDAQRIIKILQAPAHLILTLKHFRYDFDSRLRTKLRHKVMYNETIQLPVSTLTCTATETYRLYAAVVHSGYNMDYGHYFTYACDSKQNWYKFNDSYVSQTTLDDFENLKSPDTPYILFYKKLSSNDGISEVENPELSSLSKHLQELVANDTAAYTEELKYQAERSQRARQPLTFLKRNDNSDDENPPPSSCRGAINIPTNRFLY